MRTAETAGGPAPPAPPGITAQRPRRPRRWLAILCLIGPLLIFMGAFYAVPFGKLAGESVQSWIGEDVPKKTPTVAYYKKTFSSARTSRALERTFRISLIATVIALFICYPVALLLLRLNRTVRSVVLLIIFISLASSLIIRNYGWLVVLADQGPVNTLLVSLGIIERGMRMVYSEGATVVALVHYVMPFMILPIYGSLLRIPHSYSEASTSLGANAWTTFRKIVFPLSMPGVFGGTILCFAICMSAFVTPLMLGSPSTAMISQVAAEQMLVQQNAPYGSAIVVVMTGATFLAVLVYALIVRKVLRADV